MTVLFMYFKTKIIVIKRSSRHSPSTQEAEGMDCELKDHVDYTVKTCLRKRDTKTPSPPMVRDWLLLGTGFPLLILLCHHARFISSAL